ncbi:MAG: ubiquinone/menaquinone biosynthesis methyltransferase [Deltaproteobacteria bacterium]|nr:ubiquinone/menaquinone biosynthesis methyltransferase [Deltaproteobacteria bacterium]MBM4299544.1 ubiquinone/menaquinone biosynthesis methyltransferase [Deltaproteobacteria bacterium]
MLALDNSRDRAVQSIFDRIAGRYDLLNRVISFRLDNRWRAEAIRTLATQPGDIVLDLGAGTGDLTFAAAKRTAGRVRIVGLDFSLPMLQLAQHKKRRISHGAQTTFVLGSAMAAPIKSAACDGAMTAFVLRNVSDLPRFFAEAFRIMKPGARFVSLDMFPPTARWFAPFYNLYFYRLVPWIGGALAGDRNAYSYLSRSVRQFHSPETVAGMIAAAGFRNVAIRKFLNGAVCLHSAQKPPA